MKTVKNFEYINKIPSFRLLVHNKFWNQGFGSEAAKKLLNYAKNLGYKKILYHTHEKNIKSKHLAKKLGFLKTGRYKIWDSYLTEYRIF